MPPVLRAILGVIGGYLVMAVLVAVGFGIAWIVMGAAGAFQAGTYEVTTTWVAMSFGVGFVAAIIGGFACALIAARGSKAGIVLAVLVLALGAFQAGMQVTSRGEAEPVARESDEISMQDAALNAEQPMLTLFLNPVIGAVGVLIGAKLRGGKPRVPAPPAG